MTLTKWITVAVVTVILLPATVMADAHSYFDALVARGDKFKAYSLRDPAQLRIPREGGYASSNSDPLSVTFDPQNDPNPERQDAAKAVIPAMRLTGNKLVTGVDASATRFPLSDSAGNVTAVTPGLNVSGRQIRFGTEMMIATNWPPPCPATNPACNPLDRTTGILNVTRGQYGTTPTAHAAGVRAEIGGNSLSNQVRVPLVTMDGNSYFFVWDSYHTRSYLDSGLTNHKAFQFDSDGIWFEPQTRFDGGALNTTCFNRTNHVAVVEARSYNNPGGGLTDNQPVQPKIGEFCLHPSRWTRWFVLIEQRANDYDYMSMWMADEVQNPVQIYNRVPLSVRTSSNPANSISKWWIELNTSQDQLAGSRQYDLRDLVSYHRNFVSLINPPADVTPFLVRPDPNVQLPPLPPVEGKRPAAPAGLSFE